MNVLDIIERYYKKDSDIYNLLIDHSTDVTNKAISIAEKHPELEIDIDFVKEAAMLHDVGIFMTNAPSIHCQGILPYLTHGYLGADILTRLGYPRHALVCERHTGTGISLEEIIQYKLPLPKRDLRPISIEEQVVCFSDCFFSKTKLGIEKTVEDVRETLVKHGHGDASLIQFDKWCEMFL